MQKNYAEQLAMQELNGDDIMSIYKYKAKIANESHHQGIIDATLLICKRPCKSTDTGVCAPSFATRL